MAADVVKLVAINGRFTHSCLAIFYLRQQLARRAPQLQVELCQLTINDTYYETLLKLAQGEPAALLFSAVIWNSVRVEQLLVDLARLLPQALLVVGGPQAEIVGAKVAGRCPRLCVVKGEAEALPESFYAGLAGGDLPPKYEVSFFKMEQPRFDSPYLESDFTGPDAPLTNRHVYYESSRGCPFRCSYCLSSAEQGVVHKELEQVKRELRLILAHSPKIIRFIDRTFNDLPQRALELWRFLAEEGGATRFHFELAPERFTEEMFLFLAQLPPGMFQFEIGIQSTDPLVLEAVHRRADGDLVQRNISRLAALGTVHLHLDLILGLPRCTEESFYTSFREVFAMGGHYIQMGLLKVLPDTEMARRAVEYGLVITAEPPWGVVATRWLGAPQLARLYWYSELVEKFMNNRRFAALWEYLREQDDDIALLFSQLLELCCRENFFSITPTHELMGGLLLRLLKGRTDEVLVRHLLLLDWLRCGNRRLPEWFEAAEEPARTRTRCRERAPEELAGLYDVRGRSRFFRKTLFVRVAPELAEYLCGERLSAAILCLCVEGDGGLHGWQRVVLVESGDGRGGPATIKEYEMCRDRRHGASENGKKLVSGAWK